MKAEGIDIERFPIFAPQYISHEQRRLVSGALHNFAKNTLSNTFLELGASFPEEVSLDKVKTDRRELDRIIMGEILGLTDEEQLEVYRAVIDLVRSRIEKARSLGQNRKKVDGINIGAVRNIVMDRISREEEK